MEKIHDKYEYEIDKEVKPCYVCGKNTRKLNYIFKIRLCKKECMDTFSKNYIQEKYGK